MNLNEILSGTGVIAQADLVPELLDRFGLNWKVAKQPLILQDGTATPFFGIVREDNKQTFATCKDGYEPFQNSELVELVNEAAGNLGLAINRGGKFKDGALVYLQLETGSINGIGQNGDTVQKYVSAMNSHDGSLSLKWGLTNITISCQNTFWMATKQMTNTVKHTENMRRKVDGIIRQIEAVQGVEKTLYDTFFKLADAPVKKVHIEDVTRLVLDIDLGGKKSDMTAYQLNRLQDLSASIAREMRQKGDTLWGLFSGVTRYTTHMMPGGSANRAQSKAIGKGLDLDNKVLSNLVGAIA